MRRNVSFWNVAIGIAIGAAVAACQPTDEAPLSIATSAVAGTDRLNSGESLFAGQSIVAGGTALAYQSDNNLVLYQNGSAVWATMAGLGHSPGQFAMQGDCNAVVYSASGPDWASGTSGQGSSCYAQVIEGDWFICSGTNRVFSARGGGSCGGGGGPSFRCSEPSGAVPLPLLEHFHVRIDPDSLYVCDTQLNWEAHFPWPQPPSTEINEQCVGACGAGCTDNTCTRTGVGNYVNVGGGVACRDTHYECYSTDCCWYHDLCGRMFPTAVFTAPFCHSLAILYGCVACIGPGFNGCSVGPSYTRGFDHPYTAREDCICQDRPGDCYNDCTGQCFPGCDINFDCYDDCTGQYVCGYPFCPDYCNGLCGGAAWCYYGGGVAARTASEDAPPDLEVRLQDRTMLLRSAELAAVAAPLADTGMLSRDEEKGVGARIGWSLRDLVHEKLGGDAAAVAVIGEDGARVELDAAAWDSLDSTPILRVNRRGQLRFHWIGTRNRLPGMKGVQAIEVVRR
jgi:hypothetical protein